MCCAAPGGGTWKRQRGFRRRVRAAAQRCWTRLAHLGHQHNVRHIQDGIQGQPPAALQQRPAARPCAAMPPPPFFNARMVELPNST